MVVVIIFLLGQDTLEHEIKCQSAYREFDILYGVPKALLPIGGKAALSYLYDFCHIQGWTTVLITDAANFNHAERWALGVGFEASNIFNVGTVQPEKDGQNFIESLDLAFGLKLLDNAERAIFLAAELLLDWEFSEHLHSSRAASENHSFVLLGQRLVRDGNFVTLDASGSLIAEVKASTSSDRIPIALSLCCSDIARIASYIDKKTASFGVTYTPGSVTGTASDIGSDLLKEKATTTSNEYLLLLDWLCKDSVLGAVAVSDEPSQPWSWVTTQVTPQEYLRTWRTYSIGTKPPHENQMGIQIKTRAYARVGLLGNPSDGFNGCTMSLLISNFWAEVALTPNEREGDETVTLRLNSLTDPLEFQSLLVAQTVMQKDGYYGVARLFLAAIAVFVNYCRIKNLPLKRHGFQIFYSTNIPRQVGLAGSSALITALIKALIQFHGHDNDPEKFPAHMRANLALGAEKDELGIAAGQQDRVIQAYGGLVFMDFNAQLMNSRGYGEYEPLSIDLLPKGLWLAYVAQPSDSGQIHNNVRARFLDGDEDVIGAMQHFGNIARRGREALINGNHSLFAELMDDNLNTRRSVYGDVAIGENNLQLVSIARAHGHSAKFSGSGGCVIGMWKGEPDATTVDKTRRMRREMQKNARDKYGRHIAQRGSDLKRFYRVEEDEDNEEDDDNEEEQGEDGLKNGAAGAKQDVDSEIGGDLEDDDLSVERDETTDRNLKSKPEGYSLIRGEEMVESSDEDEDIEETTEIEIEMEADAEEDDDVEKGPPSRRFAAVNMDWDNMKASDLWKAFDAFKPKNGQLVSVSVLVSDFGKERIEREQREGPPSSIFKSAREELQRPLFESDQSADFEEDSLRKYQLERLKYYYAVVECDSVATAKAIVEACDGAEFENSAILFDLRYIPDSMAFDNEVRDRLTAPPVSYTPANFVTAALQHSKVKLTWDEDDPERVRVTKRKFTKEDLNDMDFKAYLASDSDDSDAEARTKRYKALLLGKPEDSNEDGDDHGDEESEEKKADDDVDMEITFTPGLSEAIEKKIADKKVKENETVFEAQIRKRREKRKERKAENRISKDEINGDPENDNFFISGTHTSTTTKKSRQSVEDQAKSKANLELIMMDESKTQSRHFDMKQILKAEKQKLKKPKRRVAVEEIQEDFSLDVADPRFAEALTSHQYAIDPTNPNFKKTSAMDKFLEVRRKLSSKTVSSVAVMEPTSFSSSDQLKGLVESVKRKTRRN